METNPINNQTNLLTDPKDVVYDCIFPLLGYRDLLRLRRVCKLIKAFSDEFIRNNYKEHVREINETNYPFSHFLLADLPTPFIRLQNSSSQFFENPDIPEFLRLYGDKITHVEASYFNNCISSEELQFYSSLANIQHLELDCIDGTNRDNKLGQVRHPFPNNFRNLKTLKVNEIWVSNIENLEQNWELITFCENLKYLKFPPLFKNIVENKTINRKNSLDFVNEYIESRQRNNPYLPNLLYFDLEHHGDISDYRKFRTVIKLCYRYNIKLLNVPSVLVDRNLGLVQSYLNVFTRPLVSLRNFLGLMMLVELPNLEHLVIETEHTTIRRFWPRNSADDEDSSFGDDLGIDAAERKVLPEGLPQWPKLKSLDLEIDSMTIRAIGENIVGTPGTGTLFQFLFPSSRVRETVEELAIRFYGRVGLNYPVPEVRIVTKSCPFVTKLTLTNWFGRDDDEVCMFWEGLPLLEEVVLKKCKLLGNMAFIGCERLNMDEIDWQLRELDHGFAPWERRENEIPAFLALKKLKKLSLKNLELMPGITDRVFETVFRHLKIEDFLMTSERPLNTITSTGIKSLLSGNFNHSVERFPFKGWSLFGVSDEDFTQLQLSFRANYMI